MNKRDEANARSQRTATLLLTIKKELVDGHGRPVTVGKRVEAAALNFTFRSHESINDCWILEVEDLTRNGDDPDRYRNYMYTASGTELKEM